jgi:hypothetical protein
MHRDPGVADGVTAEPTSSSCGDAVPDFEHGAAGQACDRGRGACRADGSRSARPGTSARA